MQKTTSKRPERTVIYVRISLDQSGEALGVERQERECRELCERHGWTVAEVFVDNDLSATTGKRRPGFEAVLSSGASRIVVWHTDRLVRLLGDLERVIALEVPIHAVTAGDLDLATPSGRMVARMLTTFATYEGEHKAERMRAQHRQRADAGKPWWSQRPFGYDRQGEAVVIVETEAAQLREAYTSLGRGESYAAITRRWNEAGSVTTKGRAWTANTVRQLLLSPRNAGLLERKGEGVIGHGGWEPIIPEAEWREIVRRAGNPAMHGRGQGRRTALLSGIVTCGTCGTVVAQRHRSRNARGGPASRKVYGGKCGHATAPVEWLDGYVRSRVLRRLASPAMALAWGPEVGRDRQAVEALAEAEGLRERLDDLAAAYAEGEITREQLARASTDLRARLSRVDAVAERAYHPSPLGDQPTLAGIVKAWDATLDDLAQRAIIRSLAESVVILPRPRGAKMAERFVTINWAKL